MNVKSFFLIFFTCVVDICAMYFGYLSLWILGIFLTLLLVFSAVMTICAIFLLDFKQVLLSPVVEKNAEARLSLQCRNRGIFLYPRVRCIYRNGDFKEVAVCPGTQSIDVGYIFHRKGIYPVGLDKILAYDAFKIFYRKVRFPEPELLYVLPKADIFRGEIKGTEAGKSSEEGVKKKRLEDRSTISDLREYQYGDVLNSINWKATAKRNEVIVNHYENEFCTRVFLYVESGTDPELDDYACDQAITHIKAILDYESMVTLLYSGKESVLDSNTVKSFDEYGIYLAQSPAGGFTDPDFWEQDRMLLEKAFFQKDTYNQAVFYLQRPMTAEMERLVGQLENMHIKVTVERIKGAEDDA